MDDQIIKQFTLDREEEGIQVIRERKTRWLYRLGWAIVSQGDFDEIQPVALVSGETFTRKEYELAFGEVESWTAPVES